MSFFVGIIMSVVGFLFVFKTEWLVSNFGRIGFFDDKFGTEGGTRLGYKLIGFVVIFLGFLSITGMIGGFLNWAASPITQLAW